ncbi:uncharacterized protein CC84DRAFT_1207166 [Paraphaeosphaeria sporulosa]|uniref:Uncharacterized protein n=1 Tax=Paraphaeosphaeria sporulosa TaxID=1460663 RepID=A0A177CAR9_9PLEO|nr:uncharacterized protein CC84DRAFT_1207166 [Paraphaeosphaeria sporulosa]OAG03929.1 hypothetical protein CC84DRAFT_1207166 [Paraphaeosphaeria sporulosa]
MSGGWNLRDLPVSGSLLCGALGLVTSILNRSGGLLSFSNLVCSRSNTLNSTNHLPSLYRVRFHSTMTRSRLSRSTSTHLPPPSPLGTHFLGWICLLLGFLVLDADVGVALLLARKKLCFSDIDVVLLQHAIVVEVDRDSDDVVFRVRGVTHVEVRVGHGGAIIVDVFAGCILANMRGGVVNACQGCDRRRGPAEVGLE